MNFLWLFIETLMSAIDIGLLFFFCNKKLGVNEIFERVHIYLAMIVAIIIVTLVTYITIFAAWKSLFSIFLVIVISIIFFSENIKYRIIYSILYIIALLISDAIASVIVSVVNYSIPWTIVLEEGNMRLAMICIAKIIQITIITLILHFKNEKKTILPLKFWYIFLLIFSFMLCTTILILEIGFLDNKFFPILNLLVIIAMLIILIFYISVYYFYYQLSNYIETNQTADMIEYQKDMIEKYLIQTEESNKILRILSHDLKHNILSWKNDYRDKTYKKSMEHILEYEKLIKNSGIIDVENEIANVIINQKLLIAKKNDIEFEVRGIFYEDIMLSKIEICSLLGNLLDNALEAIEKVQSGSAKRIRLDIKRNGYFLLLKLENTYAEEPVVKNKVFISNKKNRFSHGIGMISIEKIVSNYDGAIDIDYANYLFVTTIMLRAYSKNIINHIS